MMDDSKTVADTIKKSDFDIQPLKGDASKRSYFRLKFKSEKVFPKSVVMMKCETPKSDDSIDFIKLQAYLHSCNLPVPSIYLTNEERGLIYLEDCGDELMADRVKTSSEEKLSKLYQQAIDLLIKMQTDGTRKLEPGNPAKERKFDTEKYLWELNHTATYYIKKHLKKKLSPSDEKRLSENFLNLVKPIENEPMFFTHRDYHSRNLMLKGDRMFILDFQDARMGPAQYDLASLLFDSYVKLDGKVRNGLLGYYLFRMGLMSKSMSDKDRFLSMYYRVALQRNIKALGTFGYQAAELGNDLYLQFVPDTLGYINENIGMVKELLNDADWITSLLAES